MDGKRERELAEEMKTMTGIKGNGKGDTEKRKIKAVADDGLVSPKRRRIFPSPRRLLCRAVFRDILIKKLHDLITSQLPK